jgi:hypothetical protein
MRAPRFRQVRSDATSVFDAIALPVNIARVWLRTRGSDAMILHNGRFKSMPAGVLIPLFCRSKRGRLTKPANLTILLVHNRPWKTLIERNLDYLGIEDYSVIRMAPDVPWRHTARLTAVLDYLRSGRCTTEYVLWCDCDDALIRDDPQKAIDLLEGAGCEMLVSSTAYAAYHGMPELKKAAIATAPPEALQSKRPRIHPNAGVFVARRVFLQDYLEEAQRYVTDQDLPIERVNRMADDELLRTLPAFPRGVGCDQTILRYLLPRFGGRIKIDYASRLALR